jgi:hypothetical protein
VLRFHSIGSWVVVLSNGLAGAWVLAANWWLPLRRRSMWLFVIAAQVSIFVEVIAGVWLVAVDDRQPADLHMFYGFIALATVGIMYSYRIQVRQHRFLLYGLGGLFLMGLAIRAMVLDGG